MSNDADLFPKLPALKGLGQLADVRPCIVIDSREKCPLVFSRLASVQGTLTTGDYSAVGLESQFAIERKSLADLTACCTSERDRFERQLHRLRGFRFARLLVVSSIEEIQRHNYRSRVQPKAVLHSLAAWEARFVPICFEPNPVSAAERVESWAYWFSREIVNSANSLLRGHKRTEKLLGKEAKR